MTLNRRIKISAILLLSTLMIGTFGYALLGGSKWSLFDGLYMTVITLSTVGYGETHNMEADPRLRAFTIFFILYAFSTMTFAFTSLTSFIVEGEFNRMIRRKRMSMGINELRDHYILCGAGKTGIHVLREMIVTNRSFVVVETDEAHLEALAVLGEFLHVIGDATQDEVLLKAGIDRAFGLLACLPDDRDNLFLTISARQLNPAIRIISKCVDVKATAKLKRAGADGVVSPQLIGGLRLASEMIRPHVVGFLDRMLRSKKETVRIEEVQIRPASIIVGRDLATSGIRAVAGILVLAILDPNQTEYTYNPPAVHKLQAESILVVLGNTHQIRELRLLAGHAPARNTSQVDEERIER